MEADYAQPASMSPCSPFACQAVRGAAVQGMSASQAGEIRERVRKKRAQLHVLYNVQRNKIQLIFAIWVL